MISTVTAPADTSQRHRSGQSSGLNLQADAVLLCLALKLTPLRPEFMHAVEQVLRCQNMSAQEFRKHGSKITRLIETARETLEAAGICLYSFASPSPLRDAYFSLLRMLETRRGDLDPSLQARATALLYRLSSNFLVQAPSAQFCNSLGTRKQIDHRLTPSAPNSTPPIANSDTRMPPPDAFPPVVEPPIWRRKRRARAHPSPAKCCSRQPISEPARPSRRRRMNLNPNARSGARARRSGGLSAKDTANEDSENLNMTGPRAALARGNSYSAMGDAGDHDDEAAGMAYHYRNPPLSRRFGIFCTGNSFGR
ncbi:unnamed protein product [Mycena citricolor]|uniref:Uncharacterized protein n=1 Tax=Mycena citricolor TaxID=2018698 RepID=A0AAD2H755_9AGAR|nr:unnamed protein product [Mycena citricolor]